jgi:iron-regulated transporter 1
LLSLFIGYAYSQGLSEDLIGGLVAAAACSGIIGTFLYPKIRHQIGLQRTGLYALAAEVSSLTLCVISIFCPGSPFDPLYFSRNSNAEIDSENLIEYTTSFSNNITTFNVTTEPMTDSASAVTSYVSISLLLTGIIGARIGKLKLYPVYDYKPFQK